MLLTVLTPGASFPVPNVDGVEQFASFRAHGGYLYFLMVNNKFREGARSAILKTDMRGKVISRLDFQGRLQELEVDQSGQVLARHAQWGGPFSVLVWDADGKLQQTFETKDAEGPIGFHRGQPVTIVDSNI
jgi:hypothetical protein